MQKDLGILSEMHAWHSQIFKCMGFSYAKNKVIVIVSTCHLQNNNVSTIVNCPENEKLVREIDFAALVSYYLKNVYYK